MRKLLFFVMIAICLGTVHAQERKLFWDGYDWRKVDRICQEYPEYSYWIKSAYLSGLFDGKLYYQLKFRDAGLASADSVFADLLTPDNLRSLIAGLDHFYEDNTIRYIPIPAALIATVMTQQHYPPEDVEAYLWQARDWINDLMERVIAD